MAKWKNVSGKNFCTYTNLILMKRLVTLYFKQVTPTLKNFFFAKNIHSKLVC